MLLVHCDSLFVGCNRQRFFAKCLVRFAFAVEGIAKLRLDVGRQLEQLHGAARLVSAQELVATYEVEQGRIARAWFSFGALTRLRVALPADVPAMNALIARSGVALSAGFYTQEQAEAVTRHVFGVDTQLVADRTYFVIERDGAMLACGGWSRRATLYGADRAKSGPDPLLDPASQPGRIRAFFVEPSAARQGLGSMLMRHCERQALAAGFSALELAATLPGVPLYRASGFAVTEDFHLDLPDDIKLPLARMHKRL